MLEVVNWMYRGKDVGEMGALSINADDSRVAYNENEAVHKTKLVTQTLQRGGQLNQKHCQQQLILGHQGQ